MSNGNYAMSLDEIQGGEELREDVDIITTNLKGVLSFNEAGGLIINTYDSNFNINTDIVGHEDLTVEGNFYLYNKMHILDDVSMEKNVDICGTLTVKDLDICGSFITSNIIVDNLGIISSLDVCSNATFHNTLYANKIVTTGDINLNTSSSTLRSWNLEISNNIICEKEIYANDDLHVYGKIFACGGIDICNSSIDVCDNLTVRNHTLLNTLYVNNEVSFNNIFKVTGDVSFGSKLDVVGDVSFGLKLDVVGDVSFGSKLDVDGDVSFYSGLSVVQDAYFDSSVNIYGDLYTANNPIVNSDDRLKHNEQNITNGLTIIRALTPQKYDKTFTMLDENYNGDLTGYNYKKEAGIIAQEALNIDELTPYINVQRDPYSIDYNSIFTYNIAATKELDQTIEEEKVKLTNEIEKMNLIETILTISDDSYFKSSLDISKHLIVHKDSYLHGPIFAYNDFSVTGDTSLNGSLEISNHFIACNESYFHGPIIAYDTSINTLLELSNHLTVFCDSDVYGDILLHKNMTIDGRLDINKDVSLNSSLEISNNLIVNERIFLRLKDNSNNCIDISNPLLQIMELNGYIFSDSSSINLLIDDFTNNDFSYSNELIDGSNIDYNGLCSLLIESTKELNEYSMDIDNRVKSIQVITQVNSEGNIELSNNIITHNSFVLDNSENKQDSGIIKTTTNVNDLKIIVGNPDKNFIINTGDIDHFLLNPSGDITINGNLALNKLDDNDISVSLNKNIIFDMNNDDTNYFKVKLPSTINNIDKSFKIKNNGYVESGNLNVKGDIQITGDSNYFLINANNSLNERKFSVDQQGNLFINGNIELNNNSILTTTTLSYLTDISSNIQQQINDIRRIPTCTRIECGPSTHEFESIDDHYEISDSDVKERMFFVGHGNNTNEIFGLGFVENNVGVFIKNSEDNNESSFKLQGYFQCYNNDSSIHFKTQYPCITNLSNDSIGLIVSTNGNYLDENNELSPTINESLPICEITTTENDKKVFGVISSHEDDGINRKYGNGTYVSIREKKNSNERRSYINSIGHGGIWVSNKNGILENGDYISSSSIPGYGMKQTRNEDCFTNYTVAKITCDCDFSLTKIPKQQLKTSTIVDLSGIQSTIIDYDISGNIQYENNLDSSGLEQYIYKYNTRFLEESGTIIETETEYNNKLTNGENVFVACFVGCTYKCG